MMEDDDMGGDTNGSRTMVTGDESHRGGMVKRGDNLSGIVVSDYY